MLVLVTNSRMPYCFDAPRTLALPIGATHRFRYDDRWIDRQLTQKVPAPALVVLRDFATGRFIPIRFVTVVYVRDLGATNYIEFEVGEYPDEKASKSNALAVAELLRQRGINNTPGAELEPLVFDVPGITPAPVVERQGEDLNNWDRIATEAGQLDVFREYSFFRFASVRDGSYNNIPLKIRQSGNRKAIQLRRGKFYFLELVQKIPFELAKNEEIDKPFTVEVTSTGTSISVFWNVKKVVGKYDLLQFGFRTSATDPEEHAEMHVHVKEGHPFDSGAPVMTLSFAVVQTFWERYSLRILQWAAGLAGFGLMYVAEPWGKSGPISADIYRAIAALLIALALQDFKGWVKEQFAKRSSASP